MIGSSNLVAALKQSLKENGKTYADLADAIDLSEASIKRLFADQSFSLKRLEEVCTWLGIEIGDLVRKAEANRDFISILTLEQETELANNPKLLMVAVLVTNHWCYHEILDYFTFTPTELTHFLAQLDKLGLIELLPRNRVKTLTAKNFKWQTNGPVQKFFYQHVQSEFFKSAFLRPDESLHFMSGMLSEESRKQFQKSIEKLNREFENLSQEDAKLPLEERHGVNLMIATRPWDLSVFHPYIKDK